MRIMQQHGSPVKSPSTKTLEKAAKAGATVSRSLSKSEDTKQDFDAGGAASKATPSKADPAPGKIKFSKYAALQTTHLRMFEILGCLPPCLKKRGADHAPVSLPPSLPPCLPHSLTHPTLAAHVSPVSFRSVQLVVPNLKKVSRSTFVRGCPHALWQIGSHYLPLHLTHTHTIRQTLPPSHFLQTLPPSPSLSLKIRTHLRGIQIRLPTFSKPCHLLLSQPQNPRTSVRYTNSACQTHTSIETELHVS